VTLVVGIFFTLEAPLTEAVTRAVEEKGYRKSKRRREEPRGGTDETPVASGETTRRS
jgi:hypothetical protein